MRVEKKNQFEDYKVHTVSGGGQILEKPLFVKKGKNVIIPNNETVHVYRTQTGEHQSELFTCPSKVTCLQLDPNDEDFFIASTTNGEIFRSSCEPGNEPTKICQLTLNAEILQQQEFRKLLPKKSNTSTLWSNPVSDAIFHHIIYESHLTWASWSTNDEYLAHISVFNNQTGDQVNQHSYPAAVLQKTPENFVLGGHFLACMAKTSIYVLKLSTGEKVSHLIRKPHVKFTKIAHHPEEAMFATGDTLGCITVWRNIHNDQPLRDVYHWHTLPVRALAFTECGSHMFSGGEENVLVKWSLASRMKSFLPRLSSNIFQLSIAQGSTLLSISTTDAKVLIINVGLSCVSTIQHFSRWSTVSASGATGTILTQDPRTDALVLSGKTGHLQFLSGTDLGRFLYTFDVTQRNFITKERNIQPGNVEVISAKFTRSGKWLVTAEVGLNEARLKFWGFNAEKQEFSLNTDVDAPHGDGITSLEVSSNELAVTTGPDSMFRLWGIVEVTHLQKTKIHWAQIGYSGHRKLPSYAADFTRDGSLLAISFGPALTLWDTNSCTLKSSLTPPLNRDLVKTVKFGNHNLSHLVITGTDHSLSCWNIVTLCRQWFVPLNIRLLVSDPNSRYMCVFTKSRNLFVFDPSSPQPEHRLDNICDAPITAAMFVTKSDEPYLYFLSKSQSLYFWGRKHSVDNTPNEAKRITPFSAQLAENVRKDVISARGLTRVTNLKKFTAGILDSPAHTLPHVSLLCDDVLAGFLLSVHVSENSSVSFNNGETNLEAFDALPLPLPLGEPELEVEVDHLFSR